jgi:putative peptidoglycan lipid II flippase
MSVPERAEPSRAAARPALGFPIIPKDEEPIFAEGPGIHRGRTVGIVSFLTLMVACLGYLREAVLAARFGVSATMDAYFGAVLIPNAIYSILVLGTLSPVLIPILLQNAGRDRSRVSQTFSVVTTFLLVVLVVLTGCGLLTVHHWLKWLFSGFDLTTMVITERLVFMVLPAVCFLGMSGILTAALNGFQQFALPTFAPALSSLVVIAAALLAGGERAIYVVGLATTLGSLVQFLLLIPATASLGIRYWPTLNFRHPAIRRLAVVGGPLFLYLAVANATLLIERNLASRISAGSVSALSYALRVFTVPSNFLAAPLAIVSYPYFAREALRKNHGALPDQLSQTLRFVVFLFVPVTVWTIFNALPITRVLYERGQFRPEDSLLISRVLMFYSIGILPNAIAVILLRCFYALEDTVTPLWTESIDLVFFLLCATWLSSRFGILGLAFTRGMSFLVVGTILAIVLWRRKLIVKVGCKTLLFLVQTAAATFVMAGVDWAGLRLLRSSFDGLGTAGRLVEIAALLTISAGAFLGVAALFKMRESERVLRGASSLFQRFGTASPSSG